MMQKIAGSLLAATAFLAAAMPSFAQQPAASAPAADGMVAAPCPPRTPEMWALAPAVLKSDWAWLCRYQPDNAAIDPAHPPRVIFIGDSITEGWARLDPRFFAGDQAGRGLSGQTSPQMLVRFYQDVIALHPRVVHIMAGTNDIAGNTGPTSPEDFKNAIRAMCDLARANGIRVVLGSILPAERFDWKPQLKPAAQIVALNAWLRGYAHQTGAVYADYYSALAGPDGDLPAAYSNDGVHPQAAGYALMRPIAERAIAAAERAVRRR